MMNLCDSAMKSSLFGVFRLWLVISFFRSCVNLQRLASGVLDCRRPARYGSLTLNRQPYQTKGGRRRSSMASSKITEEHASYDFKSGIEADADAL